MLTFPQFDPVALQLGPLAIRWYGLMYVLGFLGAWSLLKYRSRAPHWHWTGEEISDFIFYAALGVILGGRLGYVLFYNLPFYMEHPAAMFAVWEGGMSFHGGLLGVIFAGYLFTRKTGKDFLRTADFIAPVVPIGLGLGRLGNFINGELYGRASDVPWAMVFPGGGPMARHPSQLYEFLLEGVLLFTVLWIYSARPRARGGDIRPVSGRLWTGPLPGGIHPRAGRAAWLHTGALEHGATVEHSHDPAWPMADFPGRQAGADRLITAGAAPRAQRS